MLVLQSSPQISTPFRLPRVVPEEFAFHHRWNKETDTSFHERASEQYELLRIQPKSIPFEHLRVDIQGDWDVPHTDRRIAACM